MQKVREIFRLALVHKMSQREIAGSCNVSRGTVGSYLGRLPQDLLDYTIIETLSDKELRQALKPKAYEEKDYGRPLPDWIYIHHELKKKGVTLHLLWQEYKEIHPDGYQSTQFYDHYCRWREKLKPSMRQSHKAGEKMFVDYAGQTVPIRDRKTGEIRQAQVFVAVLGASNYTYAEASWDQTLPNWIRSHVRAFEFLGGVPKAVVPDNLKSGVSKACRYDPDINPAYHELSVHYGTAILPARVRKPKDKSKVEVGVQIVERWILASLRNLTFFSLRELNRHIQILLEKLNGRKMQNLDESRLSLFQKLDKPALKPLPETPYIYAEWKKARVNIDYHVELNRHYYSVPYRLIHEEVLIRFTERTVEIFHQNKRIASHKRRHAPGHHSSLKEHMPVNHRKYLEWTPGRLLNWAGQIGESTREVVKTIMEQRRYPEQGYRACLGIIRLSKRYSNERLEKACQRAIAFGGYRYRNIKLILEKGLDRISLPGEESSEVPIHSNIRGQKFFV